MRKARTKKHQWLTLVAVVSALAIALAACGGDDDDSASSASSTTAAKAADRGNVDGTLTVGALLPSVRRPRRHLRRAAHARDDGDRRDQRGRRRERQAGRPQGRRRRHLAGRRRPGLDTLLNSDKADVIVGPASSGTMEGIVDKVASAGVTHVLGFQHVGRADHGQGRRLLLPHRPAGQVPGPGARAARLERQQDEARDPRPERLLRHRVRGLVGEGAHRRWCRCRHQLGVRPRRVGLQL